MSQGLVSNNNLFKTSFSQIDLFKKCRFAWFQKYVYGLKPTEMKDAVGRGNFGHAALEVFYKIKKHGESDPIEGTKKWILENVPEDISFEDYALLSKLLLRYIEEYAVREDQGWEILDVEKWFELRDVTHNDLPYVFMGKIDIIVKSRKTGKCFTVDNKFTSRNFWSQTEIEADIQQPLYMIAVNSMGGYPPIGGLVVNQLKMYPYKDFVGTPLEKLFSRGGTYKTKAELEGTMQDIRHIVDEMYKLSQKASDTFSIPKEAFRNRSRDTCRYCDIYEPCTTMLKGGDIESHIGYGFTRRGLNAEKTAEKRQPLI